MPVEKAPISKARIVITGDEYFALDGTKWSAAADDNYEVVEALRDHGVQAFTWQSRFVYAPQWFAAEWNRIVNEQGSVPKNKQLRDFVFKLVQYA